MWRECGGTLRGRRSEGEEHYNTPPAPPPPPSSQPLSLLPAYYHHHHHHNDQQQNISRSVYCSLVLRTTWLPTSPISTSSSSSYLLALLESLVPILRKQDRLNDPYANGCVFLFCSILRV
ncbi:hypothetical protein E2C01_036952 [Portunus trituberculatus]|uniref:Uncharacterized protein n=1 Tax=Portunus trituberculatus TaxID=210409 RepID=A0A5B7FE25_PORTR|nr:hypothetical protein [Portunus trituberculatus]